MLISKTSFCKIIPKSHPSLFFMMHKFELITLSVLICHSSETMVASISLNFTGNTYVHMIEYLMYHFYYYYYIE